MCEMVYDGTDTNGDVWNRCTEHDRLVLEGAYVCESYEPPAYIDPAPGTSDPANGWDKLRSMVYLVPLVLIPLTLLVTRCTH
jgi:hypothetical protein